MLDMEVDQQSDLPAAQSHVGKQLRLVYRIDCFDALNLNDDGVRDNKINTVAEVDLLPFVNHWQPHLTLNSQSALSNLMQEARVICAFEQSGAKRGMNSHRGGDNLAGELVNAWSSR